MMTLRVSVSYQNDSKDNDCFRDVHPQRSLGELEKDFCSRHVSTAEYLNHLFSVHGA
jgi:hypothetical protein